MRDTTSSVPDVASRGADCAAPSQSSEIPNSVTSVSRAIEKLEDALLALNNNFPVYRLILDARSLLISPDEPIATSGMSAARDYLVDQLATAARHLADSRIAGQQLPLCRDCLMSSLNGRPIPHLPSCPVGRVFATIKELR